MGTRGGYSGGAGNDQRRNEFGTEFLSALNRVPVEAAAGCEGFPLPGTAAGTGCAGRVWVRGSPHHCSECLCFRRKCHWPCLGTVEARKQPASAYRRLRCLKPFGFFRVRCFTGALADFLPTL